MQAYDKFLRVTAEGTTASNAKCMANYVARHGDETLLRDYVKSPSGGRPIPSGVAENDEFAQLATDGFEACAEPPG